MASLRCLAARSRHLLMLLLSLAMAGWQLSPQREVLAHRMGMRVLLAASIVVGVIQALGKI